jgi:hypothetical protein
MMKKSMILPVRREARFPESRDEFEPVTNNEQLDVAFKDASNRKTL